MKPTHSHRWLRALVPVTLGVLVAACGGDKQLQAKAPSPPPSEALGRANTQPVSPPNTSTASNVAISQEILKACNIPDTDAYFEFDSSRLTSFDHSALGAVATCFTRGPLAGRMVALVGHADPRGTPEYNVTLGQSRADAVASYLTGHGMVAGKTSTTSRGAMDATGQDETGWAHDRRVDLQLIK